MQIEALFSGKTIVDVLNLFLMNPEQAFYQAQVVNQTGQGLLSVQNALRQIEKAGFITRRKQGRMVYYQANREHPAFEDMKRVFMKTVSIGNLFREGLARHRDKIRLAFIFGSYAGGQERAESDLDLFILGTLTLKELSDIIGPLAEKVDREVNPVIYREVDFKRRLKERNHFALELLQCPKVWLLGTDDELKKVAG